MLSFLRLLRAHMQGVLPQPHAGGFADQAEMTAKDRGALPAATSARWHITGFSPLEDLEDNRRPFVEAIVADEDGELNNANDE